MKNPSTMSLSGTTLAESERGDFMQKDGPYAVLSTGYKHFRVDIDALQEYGLRPATKYRALKKRLEVPIGKDLLLDKAESTRRDPTTGKEVGQLRAKQNLAGRSSLISFLGEEVVSIRHRKDLSRVLHLIFQASDLVKPEICFFADNVLKNPAYAKVSTSTYSSHPGSTLPVQWASIILTLPRSEGKEGDHIPSYDEREKAYQANRKENLSDEALLERLQSPSPADEQLLQAILDHLESRGALWAMAGHSRRPTIAFPDVSKRIEYIVMGLFPEPFLNECRLLGTQMAKTLPKKENYKVGNGPIILSPLHSPPNDKNGRSDSSREGEFFCFGGKQSLT